MSTIKRSSRPGKSASVVVTATAVAMLAAACSSSSPQPESKDIKGQNITVVLPSYVPLSPQLIAKFEKQSGVKVTLSQSSWDSIRDRIATAGAAGKTIGDVTELDWSWTGQYVGAGWYTPLDDVLSEGIKKDLLNSGSFTKGGHLYAACYSNDARIGLFNKDMLSKQGIDAAPKTFDEMTSVANKLKASNASKYPFALTLSATEGAVTEWNLLSIAMGGSILDKDNKAAFRSPDSAGYQALAFEVDAVKNGLADPASVSNDDQKTDALFLSGDAAFQLAGNPGEMGTVDDPKQSKIKGKAAYFLEPGKTGVGSTFGVPEGLGIPSASKHKAAAAAFINWMMQPEIQTEVYKTTDTLPCRASTVKSLVDDGTVAGGAVISEQLSKLVPLFGDGAPAWYPKFSADAAASINAAATGHLTVDEAIKRMADNVDQLAGR